MKKIIFAFLFILSAIRPALATHNFTLSASNLNVGTVPNQRLDLSSVTLIGNTAIHQNADGSVTIPNLTNIITGSLQVVPSTGGVASGIQNTITFDNTMTTKFVGNGSTTGVNMGSTNTWIAPQIFNQAVKISSYIAINSTMPVPLGNTFQVTNTTETGSNSSLALAISTFGDITNNNNSAVYVYKSTNQTLNPNNVDNTVNYDTLVYDRQVEFSTATNTFIPKLAGLYQITATIKMNTNNGTTRTMSGFIVKNGVQILESDQYLAASWGAQTIPPLQGILFLNQGDIITIHLDNSAADAISVIGSNTVGTYLMIAKID